MGGSAKVVIVGSGFAGIGLAHRLKQAGIHDVLILERGDDVGGSGGPTPIPAAPATCRPTSTRSPSHRTPSGPIPTRRNRRSRPICARAWTGSSCVPTCGSGSRCLTQRGTRVPVAGASPRPTVSTTRRCSCRRSAR
ncbi:MAG: NAD(P)-binding protein [Nocardioides sp.]|nr:NAD(P)-binding protein [Nocardioides sp.]